MFIVIPFLTSIWRVVGPPSGLLSSCFPFCRPLSAKPSPRLSSHFADLYYGGETFFFFSPLPKLLLLYHNFSHQNHGYVHCRKYLYGNRIGDNKTLRWFAMTARIQRPVVANCQPNWRYHLQQDLAIWLLTAQIRFSISRFVSFWGSTTKSMFSIEHHLIRSLLSRLVPLVPAPNTPICLMSITLVHDIYGVIVTLYLTASS